MSLTITLSADAQGGGLVGAVEQTALVGDRGHGAVARREMEKAGWHPKFVALSDLKPHARRTRA
jgi:hypothetical protein